MAKLRVALIFGGKSVEHEVSLRSAKSIADNIDTELYEIFPIYIRKNGKWCRASLLDWEEGATPDFNSGTVLSPSLDPDNPVFYELSGDSIVAEHRVDVIFPVLHGTYGEDGTVQGLFELMDAAFVGSYVLGSSIGMDKIIMKAVLKENGLPVVDYIGFTRREWEAGREELTKSVGEKIGLPCFVKSADLGSSVGVTKVSAAGKLQTSIDFSCQFSNRILVEKAVTDPREIEVSVLGNDELTVSPPGEIVPHREFYDYKAKYIEHGTKLIAPAELDDDTVSTIKGLAVRAYRALDCKGMGRVDFLIDGSSGEIFISEINTIPGFTSISMYPKLLGLSGISYKELITNLINLALEMKTSNDVKKTDLKKITDIN